MIGVGDRVVCIDDTIKPHLISNTYLIYKNWVKKDKEYIIREILTNNDTGIIGILLVNVNNKPVFIQLINKVQEPSFAIWRFRKLLPDNVESLEYSTLEDLLKECGIVEEHQLEEQNVN